LITLYETQRLCQRARQRLAKLRAFRQVVSQIAKCIVAVWESLGRSVHSDDVATVRIGDGLSIRWRRAGVEPGHRSGRSTVDRRRCALTRHYLGGRQRCHRAGQRPTAGQDSRPPSIMLKAGGRSRASRAPSSTLTVRWRRSAGGLTRFRLVLAVLSGLVHQPYRPVMPGSVTIGRQGCEAATMPAISRSVRTSPPGPEQVHANCPGGRSSLVNFDGRSDVTAFVGRRHNALVKDTVTSARAAPNRAREELGMNEPSR
jgi:hypothetical protein